MTGGGLHVCLEQPGAPQPGVEHPVGTRWVCSCGTHYLYREGFSRTGHAGLDWWQVPAVAIPRQRRASLRDLLFWSRQG